MEQRAHLYTLTGVCALPRAYLRTGRVPRATISYITQSNSGEGLLFYGSVTIPFVDRFPRGEIYDLLTTKPEDAANGKQAE